MPAASGTGLYYYYATDRPDYSTLVDGNWVRGMHEVTFGGSLRKTRDDETLDYPGTGVDSLHSSDFATTRNIQAWLGRPFFASSETVNQSIYVGDTIKAGRLTTQLALRYDRAYASMLESAQRANPGLPERRCRRSSDGRGQADRSRPVVAESRRHLRARRIRAHAAPRQLRHVRQSTRIRNRAGLLRGVAGDPDLRRHRPERQQRRRPRKQAWRADHLGRCRPGEPRVWRQLQSGRSRT